MHTPDLEDMFCRLPLGWHSGVANSKLFGIWYESVIGSYQIYLDWAPSWSFTQCFSPVTPHLEPSIAINTFEQPIHSLTPNYHSRSSAFWGPSLYWEHSLPNRSECFSLFCIPICTCYSLIVLEYVCKSHILPCFSISDLHLGVQCI